MRVLRFDHIVATAFPKVMAASFLPAEQHLDSQQDMRTACSPLTARSLRIVLTVRKLSRRQSKDYLPR